MLAGEILIVEFLAVDGLAARALDFFYCFLLASKRLKTKFLVCTYFIFAGVSEDRIKSHKLIKKAKKHTLPLVKSPP